MSDGPPVRARTPGPPRRWGPARVAVQDERAAPEVAQLSASRAAAIRKRRQDTTVSVELTEENRVEADAATGRPAGFVPRAQPPGNWKPPNDCLNLGGQGIP